MRWMYKKCLEKYSFGQIIEILPPTVYLYFMNYQRTQLFGKQSAQASEHAKEGGKNKSAQEDCKPEKEQGEVCEDTMTKTLAVPKIKISFDEEETKKIGWQNGNSLIKEVKKPAQDKKKKPNQKAGEQEAIPEIPYNKRVEEIMSKKPLRERLAGLLPADLQLPISFDHQQLLKRMELLDRTIEFLGNHRGVRVFFFDSIRKNIFETSAVVIELKFVQQLLFLDQHCYGVEWGFNDKIRKYDIKLTMPKVNSVDARKSEMRKKIVNYLIMREGAFLTEKKLTKVDHFKWHELFQYSRVDIPQKTLPVHPSNKDSDLREFSEEDIDRIQNPLLKSMLRTKKEREEDSVRSLSSASVADMIFSRMPVNEISKKIMSAIKEKERLNNQLREDQQVKTKMDKEAMLRIYDEILLIYMSKNVSNIFKVTLLELLQQRLQIRNEAISEYLDKLLKLEGLGFLKVVLSSKKLEVVQMDKVKYKEGRELVVKTFAS